MERRSLVNFLIFLVLLIGTFITMWLVRESKVELGFFVYIIFILIASLIGANRKKIYRYI